MTDVFATAANGDYGYHALNLVGSVQRNSDVFDRIEVFDLGMTAHQRELLRTAKGVTVRDVPPFSPHWHQCFTWKPWAWMQIDAGRVFWLDAGATVLRSLDDALEQIRDLGYFLASQGNRLDDIVPEDYFALYRLPERFASRPYVAAGIIGFSPDGAFFERVLRPTYEDCLAGRNLGFSPTEVAGKNRGLTAMADPPLRNCRHFRWDQTVLNIHLAQQFPDAVAGDLDRYAGWRSPHDHPQQVIWSHRRPGTLGYLKRVRYARGATRRRVWGAWHEAQWWLHLHRHLARRETYVAKARLMLRTRAQG